MSLYYIVYNSLVLLVRCKTLLC